jgi:uncharacterized protein with HEPN domain
MRSEELYLRDIVEAAEQIANFVAEAGRTGFEGSEMVRSAIVQKLAVIGEAASRLSSGIKSRHPEVPWMRIVAFRNILVHAYFGLDNDVVWRAATKESPVLRTQVANVIEREFGPGGERE